MYCLKEKKNKNYLSLEIQVLVRKEEISRLSCRMEV